MSSYNTKWIDYIEKHSEIDLDKILENYDSSIRGFVKAGMVDWEYVTGEIDLLQSNIDKNNYALHKNGYSQIMKLINGWLCEDIIKLLLDDFSAELNGSDKERKIGVKPSNDPDLKFTIDEKICFAEITNVNKMGAIYFDESYDRISQKFKQHNWWQGRANKYQNLRRFAIDSSNNAVFIINVSNELKSIMVKRVVESNVCINPQNKWFDYNDSAIALGSEYFVFSCENKSFEEIKKIIATSIRKLI